MCRKQKTIDTPPEELPYARPLAVATLAAMPFAFLQLLFVVDPSYWQEALAYGGFRFFGVGAFLAWLLYLAIELDWRRKLPARSVPWFAYAGGLLMLAFFLPAAIARPVLEKIPSSCRASQAICWKTSEGDFVLVLVGTGTVDDCRFSSGYMNWSGDAQAGFSSIQWIAVLLLTFVAIGHFTIPRSSEA